MCDYQTVPVSVELTDQNGNKLVKYLEYRGNQSLLTVVFDMDNGLVANLNYSLVVTAISGAGNISSEPNKFSKSLTLATCKSLLQSFVPCRYNRTFQ